MRKEILRTTREQFRIKMESELPAFKRSDVRLGPGIDVYVMRVAEDLFFFITLVPNTKAYKDSFMVEVGWARSESPASTYVRGKANITPKEDANVRLPNLWRNEWTSALEPWWEAGEPLGLENMDLFYSEEEIQRRSHRIPSLVEDAIRKIREHGIPLFQTVAASRGYSEAGL